jgi:hypothetical protein
LFGAVQINLKTKARREKIKEAEETYSSGILNGQGIWVKIVLGRDNETRDLISSILAMSCHLYQ